MSLSLLVKTLHFPESFFFKDDITPIDGISVSFRSLARMTATVRDSALHASHIAQEFTSWIDNKFETPEVVLPELIECEPEVAADVLRDADLSWSAGVYAATHDVYVGESFEEVDAATVPTAPGLDVASFDPGRRG